MTTLGPKSEKRHRVPVRTHCDVWGEFVQIVTERQVVEKEVSMLSVPPDNMQVIAGILIGFGAATRRS